MPYPRPTERDLQNGNSLARAIIAGQSIDGPRRTTVSMSGTPQQQVTAQAMSDILQGSVGGVRGPEDTLLVINRALSGHLDQLYNEGTSGVSVFSTVPRSSVLDDGLGLDGADAGEGGSAGGDDSGEGGSYTPGVIPPDNIPPGGQRLPWGATIYGNNTKIPGERVAQFAYWAGFRGEQLVEVVAIAKRESQFMPYIRAVNRDTQDDSYGLMMINMIKSAHPNVSDEEYLKMLGVPGKDPNLLREPQVNMNAAFAMSQRANGTLRPWGGYKGKENTYNTNIAEARDYVAKAEAAGYFRTRPEGWSGGGGSTGGTGGISPGSAGSSTAGNTPEELIYAGNIIANHPNFWAAKKSAAFRKLLTEGAGSTPYVQYKNPNTGGALLVPNLLNYLYIILEAGFILDDWWGSIVNKSNASKRSYHAHGGAIDLGGIGLASENRKVGVGSIADWTRYGDKMFNILASMPQSSWADENAWHKRSEYGNSGFYAYKDPNPNHFHFGFKPTHSGTLMAALKKRRTSSGGNSNAPKAV